MDGHDGQDFGDTSGGVGLVTGAESMPELSAENRELLQRIESFRFGPESAPESFARRLAKEQNWGFGYTERVIREYRRFLFLASSQGVSVTPSHAIDAAWHLHLLYTRSYWDEFCAKVVGRALHHDPAIGDAGDREKYGEAYRETLVLYKSVFDEEPPSDIWPQPGATKAFVSALGGKPRGKTRSSLVLGGIVAVFLMGLYWLTRSSLAMAQEPATFDSSDMLTLSGVMIGLILIVIVVWALFAAFSGRNRQCGTGGSGCGAGYVGDGTHGDDIGGGSTHSDGGSSIGGDSGGSGCGGGCGGGGD